MNKKSYRKPSMKVVKLRRRTAILAGSPLMRSVRSTNGSEEDIYYESNGIGDGYTDN